MSRLRRVVIGSAAVALAALAGCGTTQLPRTLPPSDPVEPLVQAGKKVENAVAATKLMIERSQHAEYLPDLYMRLAELYTEQARYAWLAQFERKHQKGEESHALDAPAARLLKNLAISVYDRILKEFPKYARADEAMFLMAHEFRELGEFDSMRTAYEKLIATYPQSPHRLEASLILGDAAFDAGDLDRAERNYNAVLASPVESRVHPLARYKLGWVRVNKEDCKTAVQLFEKILRDKRTPRGEQTLVATQRSLNIHREALVDLAYCYPDVYPTQPAAPYLRALAESSSDYMAAMRRVAKRFFVKEMYAQAAAALREVLGAAVSDEQSVEDARKLYDDITRGKVYDQAAVDVERIGRVYEHRYFDYRVPQAERDKLQAEFEIYARDIATKSQLVAREKKTTALHALAAAAYSAYLDYFSSTPSRLEMEQNRAEALSDAEQPYQAGLAYERVAPLLKEPDAIRQAQLNAIAAFQRALEQGGLSRMEKLIAAGGIRNEGRALIAAHPADDSVVKVKLSVARTYYDAGDYGTAAELFFALARQYPTASEGVAAAHLALDSMRLADNYERLATLGRRMLADGRLGDEKFKDEVKDIIAKTEQRQVAELTIASSGDREEKLLSYAKRYKGSGLGEQALYNALLVARTDGDVDRFYELGEEFLDQYPKSTLRVDVMSALASVASDRGDFAQASEYLEKTYAADPRGKEAMRRLLAAASIRGLLGSAKVADDVRELSSHGAPDGELDELLLQTARSGNVAALQDVLGAQPVGGVVAEFLRGYLAYQRGDRDEAAKRLSTVAGARVEGQGPAAEAVGIARFLIGDMVYEAFLTGGAGELANAIAEKSQLLQAADGAYAQAMQGRNVAWALAAITRLSDAYDKFASFLRDLKLPDELAPAEKQQLQQALAAKADDAKKHANELKAACARRAREQPVFSDLVRGCLTDQGFPEKFPVLPEPALRAGGKVGSDPPGAVELRQVLLKNPRSGDSLIKLAELYLGAGDLGMTLLILERAETVDPRSSEVHNLRGVTLQRSGEPDAAFTEFKRALDLDEKNTQARLNLAAHYAYYGYVDQAKSELKRAGGSFSVRGGVGEHPQLGALGRLAPSGESK